MMKRTLHVTVLFVALTAIAYSESLPLVDSAFLRSGTHAGTAQGWTDELELKNAKDSGDYCRIAMMKADVSAVTGTVDSATFTIYATDSTACTLYIFGVKDSASFQNWTGGGSGSATWNSVADNGLFSPKEDLYSIGDPNLVLLGAQALPGNGSDVQVSVSGSSLVDLLNNDTDGLLTFAFAINVNGNLGIRPHTQATLSLGDSGPPPVYSPVSPQAGTNVLFIAIDDFKPIIGCYGDTQVLTPRIDGLASNGVTFLNAHCQWAVCGPSRTSLATGLMPEQTGVMHFEKMRGDAVDTSRINPVVIRPNVVTLQQYFRYNGYRTAATGKVNDGRCVGSLDTTTGKVSNNGGTKDDPPSWGDPVDPDNLPANFFTSSSFVNAGGGVGGTTATTSDGKTLKRAAESVDQPDGDFDDGKICNTGLSLLNSLGTGDTQFFLSVGFKKPHLSFLAPKTYWDLYNRDDFSPHPFQTAMANANIYALNTGEEMRNSYYLETNSIGQAVKFSAGILPEEQQKELLHGYYACASFIDAQVGRLLDELEALGLHTNTIVVLYGDHGWHLGDHSIWGKHSNLEQGARVPLIIRNPFNGVANEKTSSPVAFVDLYPTLCELANLPIPEQPLAENEDPFAPASGLPLAGKSLVPILNDPSVMVQNGVITHYDDTEFGYAYRTERYRYIEWIDPSGTIVARDLYDYEQDPMETINLAGEPGYAGLVYQFSRSMRASSEAGGCERLKAAAPAAATSSDLSLGGLRLNEDRLSWPNAVGVTYNVQSSTNLIDGPWTASHSGLSTNTITLPMTNTHGFVRVDLVE